MSRRFHRWEEIIASNTCYRDDDASKSFVLYYSYVAKSLVQILLEMGQKGVFGMALLNEFSWSV